jgi:ribosomal protein S8
MLELKGTLLNIIEKSKYKKDNIEVDTKAKLQILVETSRANGAKVKELHTISIPDLKVISYRDKLGKEVSIEVGILSKEKVNFYGV